MNTKTTTRISKLLSLALRHRPKVLGIDIDENGGWTDVDILLQQCKKKGHNIDIDVLDYVVENNNKNRFSFNEDKSKIRANQGHSIKVNLGYESIEPPATLYHGTATRFIDSIRQQGLIKKGRHAVHLSQDLDTATKVGSRHGKVVILVVNAKEMHDDGHEFTCSENGVWLTDAIATKYIVFP